MTSDQKYHFIYNLSIKGILHQFISDAFILAGNMQDDTFNGPANHLGIVDRAFKSITIMETASQYYSKYPFDNQYRQMVQKWGIFK